MAGKKYKSCLAPFENEIVALRRKKPPMPYSQIAEHLKEKHQISVRRQTIETFLKIRARGFKQCKYAESIEAANTANKPATEVPSAQKQTALQTSKPKVSALIETNPKTNDTPEASSFDPSKVTVTEYSPTWNLHRPNTEEEREAYRQYIREEKLKQQHFPQEN